VPGLASDIALAITQNARHRMSSCAGRCCRVSRERGDVAGSSAGCLVPASRYRSVIAASRGQHSSHLAGHKGISCPRYGPRLRGRDGRRLPVDECARVGV
jgi:hypothetical protein